MTEILTAEELKDIRKASGLSQKKFADRLGYSQTYVRHLEHGRFPMTKEFSKNVKKCVEVRRAYMRACEAYKAPFQKKKGMTLKEWFFLIIIVLLLITLY